MSTILRHYLNFHEFLSQFDTTLRQSTIENALMFAFDKSRGVITICSIHKAKGLSFPLVIIPFSDRPLIRPINRPKIIFDSINEKPRLAFNSEELSGKLQYDDKEYEDLLNNELISYLEEELRILYVALTRAKHKIALTTSQSKERILSDGRVSWAAWLMNH